VGCGNGALARVLASSGRHVVALDRKPPADPHRPKLGNLAFVTGDFLEYDASPFDALLFTSSLHHIHPLGVALERARRLLRRGGFLVLEEFAHEEADARTATWLYATERILVSAGILPPARERVSPRSPPLSRWRRHHRHTPRLHEGAEMETCVRALFRRCVAERVPYLYRYLVHRLRRDRRGLALGRALLEAEKSLVAAGAIRPIGLRIVAVR
jgi:ubiquinone/menaquinone biosynthesis C-methylase UbiE